MALLKYTYVIPVGKRNWMNQWRNKTTHEKGYEGNIDIIECETCTRRRLHYQLRVKWLRVYSFFFSSSPFSMCVSVCIISLHIFSVRSTEKLCFSQAEKKITIFCFLNLSLGLPLSSLALHTQYPNISIKLFGYIATDEYTLHVDSIFSSPSFSLDWCHFVVAVIFIFISDYKSLICFFFIIYFSLCSHDFVQAFYMFGSLQCFCNALQIINKIWWCSRDWSLKVAYLTKQLQFEIRTKSLKLFSEHCIRLKFQDSKAFIRQRPWNESMIMQMFEKIARF